MAKQLNVNLNVSADTREAKQKFTELQQTLTKLQTNVKLNVDDSSLKEARQAAGDLQQHLSNAVNVNTGKLDLNKFSQSLRKSGQDLQGLYQKLSQMGPTGQQAFFKVAQSIAAADSSMLSLGSRLKEFGTTLANTARWQISSSVLHGLMGAVQGAYGYAEKLNKSLNNIRIVTGQTTDQMAAFAKQANAAARALSATTVDYTDAALIYYQQGIRDREEIAGRVETTIKLANVTRQSADDVSNQMTAIWNNFYDGSKSLEYYADVITALGAATASSSEEISTGLEKFSAIANTVGLSYEYATAALATVTATTRQSADVVGTAFKTLFARIQDLELGDTLEDGTTLGKYSQALNAVGVNIKDINGEVRDMDDILDDLGEKWKTIGKDQQIALAQTVAGTRQYAQLIALMDNWDFMKENLQTVSGAEGTLQQQADIYAESWEAARDRVTAAAEEIYSQLLNDDFFIKLLNGFEKFLGGISNVIDGLGGLKGMLLMISSIFMQQYAKEMPRVLQNLASNVSVLNGQAEKNKQVMLEQLNALVGKNLGFTSNNETEAQKKGLTTVLEMTMKLNQERKNLSQTEAAAYETEIKLAESYTQAAVAIGKQLDIVKQQKINQMININSQIRNLDSPESQQAARDELKNLVTKAENVGKLGAVWGGLENKAGVWLNTLNNQNSLPDTAEIKNLITELGKYSAKVEEAKGNASQFEQIISRLTKGLNATDENGKKNAFEEARNELTNLKEGTGAFGESLFDANAELTEIKEKLISLKINKEFVEDLIKSLREGAELTEEQKAVLEQLKDPKGPSRGPEQLSVSFTKLAGKIMQVTMLINQLKNLLDIWNNDDLTTGEKLLQTFTALATIIPIVTNVFNKDTLATLSNIGVKLKLVPANLAAAASEQAVAAAGWATLGVFALIAAAIAVLIISIKAISDAWNADAIAAENAKKAAQELTEVYNETKQAYDSLKQSIANYTDAQNGIKKLTEGTQEWRDAIIEANDKALELINTYGIAADQYSIEGGLIKISQGALTEIENQRASAVTQAQITKINAQTYANQAQTRADITKLGRSTNQLTGREFAAYAAAGALMPVAGAAVGLISELAQTKKNEKLIADAVHELTSGKFANDFKQGLLSDTDIAKNLGLEDLAKTNDDLINNIKSLAKEVNLNSEASRASAETIANSILVANGITPDNPAYNVALVAGANVAALRQNSANEKLTELQDLEYRGWYIGSKQARNKLDEEKNAYLETAAGQKFMADNYISSKDQIKYDFATGRYRYTDANGKRQTLTLNQIATGVAAAEDEESINNAETAVVEYLKAHPELQSNQAIMSFLGSHGTNATIRSNATYSDFKSMQSGEALLELIPEELLDLMKWTPEERSSRAEAIAKNTNQFWNNILNKAGGQALRNALENVSPDAAEAYSKYGSWMNPGLNALLNEVDKKDQGAVLEKLMGLNWSDYNVYDQAKSVLASFGVQIDLTSDKYQNAIKQQHKFTNAIRDFTKLKSDIVAVNDALSGLDFGKSVDEETYQLIAGRNVNWANDNFILGANGQYTYLGTAEEAHAQLLQYLKDEKATWFENNENTEDYYQMLEMIVSATASLAELEALIKDNVLDENDAQTLLIIEKQRSFLLKQQEAEMAAHVELLNEEIDRYHTIEKQLVTLAKYQSYVNKLSNVRVGESRIIALNKENELLAKQIRLEEQYMEKAGQYRDNDYSALLFGKAQGLTHNGKTYDQYGLNNFGISSDMLQLDQYGTITNYADIMRKLKNNFDSQWQAANEEGKALLTAQYEGIKKLLSQYEASANLYLDKVFELENLKQERLSKNYEILSTKFEKQLKLTDNELKQIDYTLKRIGDDAFRSVEALSKLFTNEPGSQDKAHLLTEEMQTLINQVDELETSWRSGQIEDSDYYASLEKLQDQLYGVYDAWAELDEQMKSYYSNTMDKAMEKVNQLTDAMAHNMEVIQHLQNILNLTGGSTDYATIGRLLQARFEMAEDELAEATAEKEHWADQVAKAESDTDLLYAQQQYMEAESKYYEKMENYLQSGEAVRENAIQQWRANIDNVLTNGMGWDFLNKMMDIAEKTDDKYLTKTNQLYETNKMLRDIENEINKTSSQNAKQELNNFAKKITSLQSMNKLNKDAWEIAKAQYNIEKARLALEEAKDAKSTVRLQRDSEGNYGYVYTADADKISNLEQQLADSENNYYNLVREQDEAATKELIQVSQDYWNEREKLEYDYRVKGIYTEEEYNKKLIELNTRYNEYSTAITENWLLNQAAYGEASITNANDTWTGLFDEYSKGNLTILDQANSDYQTMFGNLTSSRTDWFKTESPEWQKFYSGIFGTAQANRILIDGEFTTMKGTCETSLSAMKTALGVDDNSGLRGIWNKFSAAVEEAKKKNKEYKDALTGEDGIIKQVNNLGTAVLSVTSAWKDFSTYIDTTLLTKLDTTTSHVKDLIAEILNLKREIGDFGQKPSTGGHGGGGGDPTRHFDNWLGTGPSGGNNGTTTSAGNGADIYLQNGIDSVAFQQYTSSGSNGQQVAFDMLTDTGRADANAISIDKPLYRVQAFYGKDLYEDICYLTLAAAEARARQMKEKYHYDRVSYGKWNRQRNDIDYIETLLSGGYTGSWPGGSQLENGRLAVLHQKELVLNESDTSNMLAAVSILRDIAQQIDLRAAVSSIATQFALPNYQSGGSVLDQQVTIHAEFPNATNHGEIEEAFNNLINRASQYANRF